ncbi:MAG: class I SAM-dependent methyltransferase [Acidobacteria bacterium]|nr:class I SAM-dependent methyltransferase [Acidobacteriota bacterium]
MFDLLSRYLEGLPVHDGIYRISAPRPFQQDEALYDSQHRPPSDSAEFYRARGETLFAFFKRHGFRAGAPLLEVGCGTGTMSMSLASHPGFGHLLFTDPSPAFCRLAKARIGAQSVAAARVDFAMLSAEDIDLLPNGSVEAVFLRSVLHHIPDIDDFIARCARLLPPGGILVCEEPYYEGYLMMGFLGQFVAVALAESGYTCTPAEMEHLNLFVATMQYYSRRNVDKSTAEDKHLFRPDELQVTGRAEGLDLVHYPNWHVTVPADQNIAGRTGYFRTFFGTYVRHCMSWPEDFANRATAAMAKYFDYFTPIESPGNTVPYCFGTFVFTKQR